MISKFNEINQGKQLSVAKASARVNASPVQERHSLNFTTKVRELQRIDQQNLLIMQKLQSPQASLSITDLEKEWQDQEKIKKMISKSARQNAKQVAQIRQRYLQETFTNVNSSVDRKSIRIVNESIAISVDKSNHSIQEEGEQTIILPDPQQQQQLLQAQFTDQSISHNHSQSTLKEITQLESTFQDINQKFLKNQESFIYEQEMGSVVNQSVERDQFDIKKLNDMKQNKANDLKKLKRIYKRTSYQIESKTGKIKNEKRNQSINTSIQEQRDVLKLNEISHRTSHNTSQSMLDQKNQSQNIAESQTDRNYKTNHQQFILPMINQKINVEQLQLLSPTFQNQIQQKYKIRSSYNKEDLVNEEVMIHKRKNSPFSNYTINYTNDKISFKKQLPDEVIKEEDTQIQMDNQKSSQVLLTKNFQKPSTNTLLNGQFGSFLLHKRQGSKVSKFIMNDRNKQNQTIIVKFDGNPVETIRMQKELNYKMKVLNANQKNIWKKRNHDKYNTMVTSKKDLNNLSMESLDLAQINQQSHENILDISKTDKNIRVENFTTFEQSNQDDNNNNDDNN